MPVAALLGGEEERGFPQMMRGLEAGGFQVVSRAQGVGRAAFEEALQNAQGRESFGQPIWKYQSVGAHLACSGWGSSEQEPSCRPTLAPS